VQVAPSDPPAFLSALYEAEAAHIRSATLRRPTLEDVFMVHAGTEGAMEGREQVLARAADAEESP
jgi:ABC-2 type transport system ATP-binding protein